MQKQPKLNIHHWLFEAYIYKNSQLVIVVCHACLCCIFLLSVHWACLFFCLEYVHCLNLPWFSRFFLCCRSDKDIRNRLSVLLVVATLLWITWIIFSNSYISLNHYNWIWKLSINCMPTMRRKGLGVTTVPCAGISVPAHVLSPLTKGACPNYLWRA